MAVRKGGSAAVPRSTAIWCRSTSSACNGRIAEVGGIFKILVVAPGAAVYSFSDDDILVAKGQNFTPFPGLDATYNGIEATYPEPLEKWATKDAPARYSAALESQDGNRRLASGVTFEAVPFPVQVQRLMKLLIEEDRRFRVHSFYLPPDAWTLEPNDVVSWSSVRNGYINKKFLVVRIDGERSFNQLVVLKEIDASDYDWSTDEEVPTSAGPVGPIVNPSHPMFGWQALPATLDDGSGPRRPTIEVFYAGDQDGVDRIRVEVYQKDTGNLWFDGEMPYDAPLDEQYSTKLVAVFAANTDYLVRGIFVCNIGKNFTWSGLIEVTTPDIRLGADDIYLPGMVDGVLARLDAKLKWIEESTHYSRDELDRLNSLVADTGSQSANDKFELIASVGAFDAKYAVPLHLIEPLIAAWRLLDEKGEGGFHPHRHGIESKLGLALVARFCRFALECGIGIGEKADGLRCAGWFFCHSAIEPENRLRVNYQNFLDGYPRSCPGRREFDVISTVRAPRRHPMLFQQRFPSKCCQIQRFQASRRCRCPLQFQKP
ncbi:phage tail protein [Phyllobacterium endophyticum]|uniref:phage tail protein n=1 Tax=Phyllobacterium endophyticum TaxID=1149773 RepID=UPI0016501B12